MNYEEVKWSDPYFDQYRNTLYSKHEKVFDELEIEEGEFTCPRCKGNRASYYQLQTRSGDEAMTTFLSCLNPECRNRWKE